GMGVTLASCVAAGFVAVDTVLFMRGGEALSLRAIRALTAVPAHLFCSGLWGYALGSRARGGKWFVPVWLLAIGVRGVYDYIVFGRGPGMLALSIPMLIA